MKKAILFCLALFVFCSLHTSVAGEDRELANTTPTYEEDYGTSYASNSSPNSGYGGNSGSGYGGSSGSGYGGSSSSGYGSNSSSSSGYGGSSSNGYGGSSSSSSGYGTTTPSYEEEYESSSSYYGGNGSTPSYEEEYEEGSSYYGGYEYEENMEEYESSYGYGGNPSYNNTSNETYIENYEEAYTGGENGESTIPFVPTSLLTGFVVDIHFLAGDPRFQYIAYHYCTDLYPGYTQCDIYNGTAANSKLVAVEVIVTAEIFAQLPLEERKLWHSHAFAVTSGILVAPNTPPEQELAVMASVMNSYGKVTDFYHSYQSFPYGGAKLAYGLAADSQIIPALADQLDQSLGLSTTWQQRAEQRKNLNPTIIEGADDYLTSGQFPQYVTQWFPVPSETGESSS